VAFLLTRWYDNKGEEGQVQRGERKFMLVTCMDT